jgi:DNA replication licensing factor MCM6
LKESGQTTLLVDYAHLSEFGTELADAIREHHYRLLPALTNVVHMFMKEHVPDHPGHKDKGPESGLFRPAFYNLPAGSTIRDLKTNRIGELMSISGTVTRTSAVRPELSIGAFRCQDCKSLNTDIIQQFKYTEVNSRATNTRNTLARCAVLPSFSESQSG